MRHLSLLGKTLFVGLFLTYMPSSSSQIRMKTIQALCVSSPSNPWRPSLPTPTPPPHPTARTLWSWTGRWVCTQSQTHMRLMYTNLHHSVDGRGTKTRTTSSSHRDTNSTARQRWYFWKNVMLYDAFTFTVTSGTWEDCKMSKKKMFSIFL